MITDKCILVKISGKERRALHRLLINKRTQAVPLKSGIVVVHGRSDGTLCAPVPTGYKVSCCYPSACKEKGIPVLDEMDWNCPTMNTLVNTYNKGIWLMSWPKTKNLSRDQIVSALNLLLKDK